MPRKPQEAPKCRPTSKKSPLRAAIAVALEGQSEQVFSTPLIDAYLEAPEHANVSVLVSALIGNIRSQSASSARIEFPSSVLPPL